MFIEQNRALSKLLEDKYRIMVVNKTTNKSLLSGFAGFSCPFVESFIKSKSKMIIKQMLKAFRVSKTSAIVSSETVGFTRGLQICAFLKLISKQV